MKFICATVLLAFVVVLANAESGIYVPKAFYTIDPAGQISPLYHINAAHQEALRRFKRSAQVSSSSSSSSSSSYSDGGPVYFNQHTAVHNSGGNGGVGLGTRFGDDTPPQGQGVYTQTSGVVDNNGKVHYNTHTGRF